VVAEMRGEIYDREIEIGESLFRNINEEVHEQIGE